MDPNEGDGVTTEVDLHPDHKSDFDYESEYDNDNDQEQLINNDVEIEPPVSASIRPAQEPEARDEFNELFDNEKVKKLFNKMLEQ